MGYKIERVGKPEPVVAVSAVIVKPWLKSWEEVELEVCAGLTVWYRTLDGVAIELVLVSMAI